MLFQMLMEIRSVASSMTSELSSQGQHGNVKAALEREVKIFDRREKWVGDFKVGGPLILCDAGFVFNYCNFSTACGASVYKVHPENMSQK